MKGVDKAPKPQYLMPKPQCLMPKPTSLMPREDNANTGLSI
jgi:hypothetical protein